MTEWWGLLRKELLEIRRDKRALLTALGLAFVAPLIIYGGLNYAIKQAVDTPPAWVEVINPEAAPVLVELMAEAKIYPSNSHDDPAPGSRRLVVEIDPGFADAIAAGEPARVILRGELDHDAIKPVKDRVWGVIQRFSASTASVRLLMRGINPGLLEVVETQEQNVAAASNNAGRMTMVIGIYVMMAAFATVISTAIDTSAGERERNVLEVLLIQPVRTLDIVTAKLAGVFIVAMMGVLLTLTFSAVAMSQVDLAKIGRTFTLTPANFISIVLVMTPIALLSSALNLLVAFFSKTFKEAQSQVTMVIMIPAFAPMALMFVSEPPKLLSQLPITGQFLLLQSIFKAETVDLSGPLTASALTLALTALLVFVTSRQLGSERSINAL